MCSSSCLSRVSNWATPTSLLHLFIMQMNIK
jgi:hypothetical protein